MKTEAYINKYSDGCIQSTGQHLDGEMHGYWEWFRKDGSKMRSGHFDKDRQIGEWITYARNGEEIKKTKFK